MSKPTPFLAQYLRIREKCQNSLLFFRMGDFYELFFEDAKIAAKTLDIVLTARGKSSGKPIPMAGVPVNNAQIYIERLVRNGHRVAVCEQTENPAAARARGNRGPVKRQITRVYTPGTVTEDTLLDPASASTIIAIATGKNHSNAALAAADVSTGEFEILACPLNTMPEQISARTPREIILPQSLFESDDPCSQFLRSMNIPLAPVADVTTGPDTGERRLKEVFDLATVDGLGSFHPDELTAAGILCDYLMTAQAGTPLRLNTPKRPTLDAAMAIDPITRKGLEIVPTPGTARTETLLGAIDRTLTAAGSRLLAARLARPLTDPDAIARRLDAVEWFTRTPQIRKQVRQRLKSIPDLERACVRLDLDRGGAKELIAICQAVRAGENALADLNSAGNMQTIPKHISESASILDPNTSMEISDLIATVEKSIVPDPPAHSKDKDVIATGVDQTLDAARSLRDDSRRVIASLQARYAKDTGIPTLKVKHNNILGYFIETSAKNARHLTMPPLNDSFQHRQSLANTVRFTTAELNELQDKIARADDDIRTLQEHILDKLVKRTVAAGNSLKAIARTLALLDVAAALAEWAEETDASRPDVDTSCAFQIESGSHPVVHSAMARRGENFIPNDCHLDANGKKTARLIVITGPNMAGKSTWLRQNALFAILAQAGSFVPARRMHLGVVDRMFSRVGAGDELAKGRSTFMVEMIETAAILNQASQRSMVILDEVGRGTATHDGLAIAWACVEHLHHVNRCRALFATHYHELTELAASLPYANNASLRAKEWKKNLVFLHNVVTGPADKSYGIQVARLAGLPPTAIARARQILERLENKSANSDVFENLPLFSNTTAESSDTAKTIQNDAIIATLKTVDPDSLNPRDALNLVYDLVSKLSDP